MASVSDFIELAPDENIVKEYRSFRMKKPQNATVNIAATNMRLILYGQSSRGRKTGRPTLTQEIRIEDIRGVEIYEKEKPKIILLILGVFFLASAALLAAHRLPSVYRIIEGILGNGSYGTVAAALLGIILLASAFTFRNREFEILVKGNSSNLNTGMFSEKTVFKEGIDSPKILRELGSIVIQIQKDKEKLRNISPTAHEEGNIDFSERKRMELGVRDFSEEYERESLFEAEKHETAEKYAGITGTKEYIPEEYSAEVHGGEEDSEEVVTGEEKPEQEEMVASEPDDKTIEEEIEIEEHDRVRERINVDDILKTMQSIENPTHKK